MTTSTPETTQEKQTKELATLRRIQKLLKTPDKINRVEVDALESIIAEKTAIALNYVDHVAGKVVPEKSPLEEFADAQDEEIKRLKAGESDVIKSLREKIVELEKEIRVLNSFFQAYNDNEK